MREVFDLDLYIRENINEILKCKEAGADFCYDDRAVEAVYKLANNFVKKQCICDEQKDDFIQECVFKFFSYIIYKWNSKTNVSIVTYAFVSFHNMYLLSLKNRQKIFEDDKVSLDKKINRGDIGYESSDELLDFIESDELSPLARCIKKEEDAFFRKELLGDEILYKYFYENKTLEAIGREIGYTKAGVSRLLNKKLDEIRKKYMLISEGNYKKKSRK